MIFGCAGYVLAYCHWDKPGKNDRKLGEMLPRGGTEPPTLQVAVAVRLTK
jgi:hypothetical protein